ncbi:hypothetical protein JCM8547_004536 [Rhodosporidiobolus lusitaniae]
MASSGVAGIPAQGVGSLQALLRRLEAATTRLEDIALTQATGGGMHALPSGASAVAGAGIPAPAPPPKDAAAAPAQAEEDVPPKVKAFDELIEGPLTRYTALSKELGGLIAEQAKQVSLGFLAERDFILLASACQKLPTSDPAYMSLIQPIQTPLLAAIDVREKNRASKDSNQMSVVSEGIGALGWVTLDSKPGPFVGESRDSAMFWVNRVIKEHKESNPKQVEWARSFVALLEDLRKYIMEHHTTGLSWNPKGADPKTYKLPSSSSSSSASAPSGGAPPPPPPPPPAAPAPPPPPPASGSPAPAAAAGDMSSVFAQLNQGESVTSGLRKVDKSEMTHKNPELRAGGAVPSGSVAAGKGPQKPPKPTAIQKKPAKTELDGNKWNIENHENNQSIVLDATELNHIVNVFNVKASIIQIKGKVNAVSLVNCPKTSILLNSLVSSLSISSSPSFTVQILGKVPTVLLDGCDSGQVYLSKDSLDAEIITAKCSAINVSLPVEGEEEGVFEEKAVPEQLKTVVVNGKLVTTVVEHSG